MSLPTEIGSLLRDRSRIRSELERLERRDAELRAALDDIDHDARRCRDALERTGWRSAQTEARGSLLEENRKAIVADLARNREERDALASRLDAVRERLQEQGRDD